MSHFECLAAGTLFLFVPVPIWHLTLHFGLARWRRAPGRFYSVCALQWALIAPVAVYLARASGDLFDLPDALYQACVWISLFGLLMGAWSVHALTPRRFFLWSVLRPEPSVGRWTATGPYRFLRHPAYVAIVLTMTAAFLATGATVLLVATPAVTGALLLVTRLEERELRSRLGAPTGLQTSAGRV